MLSSTQHLIQVDKALYLLETVSGFERAGHLTTSAGQSALPDR